MKTVFKKSHLPYLDKVLHGRGTGREDWWLARLMQDRDGITHRPASELALLIMGAEKGDSYAHCELARYLFKLDGSLLPNALGYWAKAVRVGDSGAEWDMNNLPIYEKIMSYTDGEGDEYGDIEMKCVMLTEWILTEMGRVNWQALSDDEIAERCQRLIDTVSPLLKIKAPRLKIVPGLLWNGIIADGTADIQGILSVRAEIIRDYERLIQVIFHELGHFVCFIAQGKGRTAEELRRIYGLTDERIASWSRGDKGLEVSTWEEDPDSLSYGVYTHWGVFFAVR